MNLPLDKPASAFAHTDSTVDLTSLLSELRAYKGLCAKQDISRLTGLLKEASTPLPWSNGDDTAVIASSDGFQLFAIEGFINEFVAHDPWFAGWCGVMVNLSDIAAMGGRPLAIVDALWGCNEDMETTRQILAGLIAAADAYQVPVVGGHTNLTSNQPQLAVAVLGHARHILSSFAAQPGDDLVVVTDLRGSYREPLLNWNAATTADAEELRQGLELMATISDERLAHAAKDISQAGLIGTLLMLAECSQAGVELWLDSVPRPDKVSWHDWLRTFPSYGYLLACPPDKTSLVMDVFLNHGIAATHSGVFITEKSINVTLGTQRERFWNLDSQTLMGFS